MEWAPEFKSSLLLIWMDIFEKINDKADISTFKTSSADLYDKYPAIMHPDPPTHPEALMVHIIINAIPTRYHSLTL